ncbi:MAG: arginyltransferase, partial [Myxococcales bacterium]|nr:arginyltransferase [Myxococcales bacterium]
MHLLERIIEKPRPCAYLTAERASLELSVMLDVDGRELDLLLERGWRRFGPVYFRPACDACGECVSLRVDVGRFVPSKSQRRAARACTALRRVVGAPRVDAERLGLYAKWHGGRERARGWEPNPQTRDRYAL